MELNKQKTEAIQRVRELHPKGGWCECCPPNQDEICTTCDVLFPCPTIKALEGLS
jgi:hypothetical protein